MMWDGSGMLIRYLPYIYYLRAPLTGSVVLAALGPLAFGPAHALLRGVFDTGPFGLGFSTFLICVTVFVLTLTTFIVLRNAEARFFAAPLPARMSETVYEFCSQKITRLDRLFLRYYTICGLIAAGYAAVGTYENSGSMLTTVSAAAGGIVVAFLAADGLKRAWSHWGIHLQLRFAPLFKDTWQGYLEREPLTDGNREWRPREPLCLLPSHALASVFVILYLLVFAFFWLAIPEFFPPAPTLTSVLTLLTLVTGVCSGLAFGLDRFRVPVFIPLALLFALGAQWPESDYYFETAAASPGPRLTPSEIMNNSPGPFVIVSAAGGGIQAGAWAARVLQGLEEQIPGFASHVKVISSVSGGSVGTMYFTAAFENGRFNPNRGIVDAAMSSSLDYAAHGLVYPDMVRSAVPPLGALRPDRGRILELAWRRYTHGTATLDGWREDARQHRRPAHIFNSTIVETGERLLMASLDIGNADGRRDFREDFGRYGRDLHPVTAARLSASFPYVTPVARVDHHTKRSRRYHAADGGYYDNDGIASAIDFIRSAAPRRRRILLLEIRNFPKPDDGAVAANRGWFFQLLAPGQTLLAVRTSSQDSRNAMEVDLLRDSLRRDGTELFSVPFAFPSDHVPLSWHLLESQKQAIREAWRHEIGGKGVNDVRLFLNGGTPQ